MLYDAKKRMKFAIDYRELDFFPIAVSNHLTEIANYVQETESDDKVSMTVIYVRVVLNRGESLPGSSVGHRDGQTSSCKCGTRIHYDVTNQELVDGMSLIVPDLEVPLDLALKDLNGMCVSLQYPWNLRHLWTSATHKSLKPDNPPDPYLAFLDPPSDTVIKDLVITCVSTGDVIEH